MMGLHCLIPCTPGKKSIEPAWITPIIRIVIRHTGLSFNPLNPIFLLLLLSCQVKAAAGSDWPVYLGDRESSQYSILDQIHMGNASELEVAWVYASGGARADNRSQIQCNPLVVDGVLYGTSASLKLFALKADSGEEIWRFDPFPDQTSGVPGGVNRGLVYWQDADGNGSRILFGVAGYLFAVNAETGSLVDGFGNNGKVDLKQGLGRDVSDLAYLANTPGIVYGDLIIMGGRLSEGLPAAPGHIRAFDVRTGKQVWRFNTIPHPGELGYETWPEDAWQRSGGANVWTGMALDEERGLVYCPTGSASADFYGGDRIGKNLFANTLLCLDAKTGKRVWHYQFVHHDLLDRDIPAPPNLLTIRRNGQEIPAVSQCTKSGHVFVFNRVTGEPLNPIEELAVPSSTLNGESAWPTQPFPTSPEPFARQILSYDLISDLFPDARQDLVERFTHVLPHTPFTPPSEKGTIIFPGFDGGAEWGGQAVTPEGVLFVNSNDIPWILTMVDASTGSSRGEEVYLQYCAACHGRDREGSQNQGTTVPGLSLPALNERKLDEENIRQVIVKGAGIMPPFSFLPEKDQQDVVDYLIKDGAQAGRKVRNNTGTTYAHTGYNKWRDKHGYPAVKPPWGTLNALDLNTGEYLWRKPFGIYPELVDKGFGITGTENYGGPVATAGGVLFIAATSDEYFRVYSQATGEELFSYKLPAAGYATPATYSLDGRQYVVIACGGGKLGTKSGDAYIAFALPQNQIKTK